MNSLSLPSMSAVQLEIVSCQSDTFTRVGIVFQFEDWKTYPIEMSSFLISLWLEGPLLISTRCSSCFSTSRNRTVLVSSSQKGPSPREQFSSMYGCGHVSLLFVSFIGNRNLFTWIYSLVATLVGYNGATPPRSTLGVLEAVWAYLCDFIHLDFRHRD